MSNMNVSEALAAFRRERVVSAADWTPAVTTQLKEWMLDQVTENRARVAAVVALARSGLVGELEEIDGAVSHLAKRLYEAEAVAEDLASEAVYAWLGMSTRPAGGTGKVECGEADLGRKPDKMALLRGHIRRALEDANYLDDDDLEKAETMAKSLGMDKGELMWVVEDVGFGVEEQDLGRKPDKMALFRGHIRRSIENADDLLDDDLEKAKTMAKSMGMDEGELMLIVQDVGYGVEEQDVGRKLDKMALFRGYVRRFVGEDDGLYVNIEEAKTLLKSMGMDAGELVWIVEDVIYGVEEQDVGRKPDKMALFRGYVRRFVGEDDDLYVNIEEAENLLKSMGMDAGELVWIVEDVIYGVEEQDVGRNTAKMALLRGHIRRALERVDDYSIENADDLLDNDLEKAKTMAKSMGMDEGGLTLIVQDLKHGN